MWLIAWSEALAHSLSRGLLARETRLLYSDVGERPEGLIGVGVGVVEMSQDCKASGKAQRRRRCTLESYTVERHHVVGTKARTRLNASRCGKATGRKLHLRQPSGAGLLALNPKTSTLTSPCQQTKLPSNIYTTVRKQANEQGRCACLFGSWLLFVCS